MDSGGPIYRFLDYYANEVQKQPGSNRDSTLLDSDEQFQVKRPRWDPGSSQDSSTLGMTKAAVLNRAFEIIREERQKTGIQSSEFPGQRQENFDRPVVESQSSFDSRDSHAKRGSYPNRGSYHNRGSRSNRGSYSNRGSLDQPSDDYQSYGFNQFYDNEAPQSLPSSSRGYETSIARNGNFMNEDSPSQMLRSSSSWENRGSDFRKQGRGGNWQLQNQNLFNSPNRETNWNRESNNSFSIGQNKARNENNSQPKRGTKSPRKRGKNMNSMASQRPGMEGDETSMFSSFGRNRALVDDELFPQMLGGQRNWGNRRSDFMGQDREQEWQIGNQNVFGSTTREAYWNGGNNTFSISPNRGRNKIFNRSGRGVMSVRGRGRNLNSMASERYGMKDGGFFPHGQQFNRKRDSKGTFRKEGFFGNVGLEQSFPDMQDLPMGLESLQESFQGFPSLQSQFQGGSFRGNKQFRGRPNFGFGPQRNFESKSPIKKQKRVLFFCDLPKTCSERQLLQYFSSFGKVVTVRIERHPTTQKSLQYGKVHFSEPYMAKKAFSAAPHILHSQMFQVSFDSLVPKMRLTGGGTSFKRPQLSSSSAKGKRSVSSTKKKGTDSSTKKKGTDSTTKKKSSSSSSIMPCDLFKIKFLSQGKKTKRVKLSQKLRKEKRRPCVKPPEDPHILCVFCLSVNFGMVKSCFTNRCTECESLASTDLVKFKKSCNKIMANDKHPCFWNMTQIGISEPTKITEKSAHCGICNANFEVEPEMKHLKEEKHQRSAFNRTRLLNASFFEYYLSSLRSLEKEEMSGELMKFCSECFVRYGYQASHNGTMFHRMITKDRKSSCEVCEIDSLQNYKHHVYTYGHLRNLWWQQVMSGKSAMSHNEPELFGADFVKERPSAWCRVCKVFVDRNNDGIKKHCKTREHFDSVKERKRIVAMNAAKKKAQMDIDEANDKEKDAEGDQEGVKDDSEGDEDDAEGKERGIEDGAEGVEDNVERAKANEDDAGNVGEQIHDDAMMDVD